MTTSRKYRLAAMSGLFMGLTIFCWLIPAAFFISALSIPQAKPIGLVGLLLFAIYASVWLWWRPSHFCVNDGHLLLKFPMRAIRVSLDNIETANIIGHSELKARFGTTYRVGAGGLWGGFGWLVNSKKEWIEFYISRQRDYVLLERKQGYPLLLTPEDPEAFLKEFQ